MGSYALNPSSYLGEDDEDGSLKKQLSGLVSPSPAHVLVADPQLAARTGVSNPPQEQILTSSQPQAASPLQPAQPRLAPAANPLAINPDPQGSLRPGGSNPEAQPGAMNGLVAAMRPQTSIQPAQSGLQPAQGKGGFWRGFGHVLGGVESVLAPGAAAYTPGTPIYNQRVQAQQQGKLKAAADLADVQSQMRQRDAQGRRDDARATSETSVPITPEFAASIHRPDLAGIAMSPYAQSKLVPVEMKTEAEKSIGAGHDQTRVTTNALTNQTREQNNAATNTSHETIAQARDKTQTLLGQLRANVSRANNADTNATHERTAGMRAAGSATGAPGTFKVPGDVTKKAQLASNVQENADAMEKIIARRPDLIGKIGGSATSIEKMLGDDDGDIQELAQRAHNIALASNGAHGVRNVHDTAKTENNILGGFRNGPNGIHGALQGLRGSVQTFLDDEKNFRATGGRVAPAAPPPAAIPSGNIAVRLANGRTGHISAAQQAQFLKDNPGATVVK